MNGDFEKLYNKLSVDIARLETSHEERWSSHNERSIGFMDRVDRLMEKINVLPCKVHVNEMKWLRLSCWGLLSMVLALYAVTGFFIKIII